MDVHDVSDTPEYGQALSKLKATLQVASKRKGEQPRDRKPLNQLVHEFVASRMAASYVLAQSGSKTHTSFVAPPYPPSTASLAALQKLFLKDLRLETHHRGHYALLRAATATQVLTGILFIVEDEAGNGAICQVYQQRADSYRKIEDVIQQGCICIIKEPYFKITSDGNYGLRVDHVSDLVWLAAEDEKVPPSWKPRITTKLEIDALKLKEEGNRCLKASKLYEAVEMYTKALKHTKTVEESQIIKLNRSLVNLKLGYYDEALEDAGITAEPRNPEKSLYRAARAFYELERFQESHGTFEALLSRFPYSIDAQKELVRTGQRLKEQHDGHYDFKSMYEAAKKTPPRLDCGSHLGPIVVKSSEDRGRGVFTTKDVVAGELLLCEKAFSYCWASTETDEAWSKTSVLLNMTTNRITIGTQADLITNTVQKLYRNPSLLADVIALHHGDYKQTNTTEVDGSAVIDTFLLDRIISLNCFGCPRTSLDSHFQDAQAKQERAKEEGYPTTGLFIMASYLNHSCNSNVRRSFIGDMQVIRATRNIPADTELTFWYALPDQSLTHGKMQDSFKPWGFQCTCSICEYAKNAPRKQLNKRNVLLQDLEDAFSSRDGADLYKAERLLTALEKTYSVSAAKVPRIPLGDPYLLLTRCYSARKNHLKTIATAYKVLESLGFVFKREEPTSSESAFEIQTWGLMQDLLIETFMHLWIAHYANGAPAIGRRSKEYARIAYKIVVGEDKTFGERYGNLGHRAMFEGADLVLALQSMSF